ncbi:TATA box-binding protein-associated factor RNA polymerase I subunit B [Nymphaea thermarum]|nr:TATA box-binding protein-associated factor RNA polymerase I subunit B [Nymphaea thermarum]
MESTAVCASCGSIGLENGGDGYFYCVVCGFQSQDLLEQAQEDHDFDSTVDRRYVVRWPNSDPQPDPDQLSRLQTLAAFQRLTQSQPDGYGAEGDDPSKPSLLVDNLPDRPYPFDFAPLSSQKQKQGQTPPDETEVATLLKSRYAEGIQLMMQMQCEALVEKLSVSPLICGIIAPIWFRYLADSRILEEGWQEEAKLADEIAAVKRLVTDPRYSLKHRNSSKYKADLRTKYGKKTVSIWIRLLKSKVPLSSSLAICFLACHISREAVLPTDVVRWAAEGKIPYLAAFMDIDKYLGSLNLRSVNSSLLFRPTEVVDSWQLESLAGSIAERIGLHLPPVNYFSIVNRYLKQLPVSIDKVLPYACHIFEWSMPPDLWLPAHQYRFPSRVCVMSILIVAIRLVYNINGCFHWERNAGLWKENHKKQKSKNNGTTTVDDVGSFHAADYTVHGSSRTATPQSLVKGLLHANCSDSDTIDLLRSLEMAYINIISGHDYSKDLPTYLEYCKDIIFAGKTTSYDEENLITQLWDLFKHESEGLDPPVNNEAGCIGSKASVVHGTCVGEADHEDTSPKVIDGSRVGMKHQSRKRSKRKNDDVQVLNRTYCESNSRRTLRCMKSDMEKHGFLYNCFRRHRLSPSTYLHYKRTLLHGRLRNVVHADYYILLRTCARIVEVDARILHLGLLKLEKRLQWIEEQIDCSLPAVFKCTS